MYNLQSRDAFINRNTEFTTRLKPLVTLKNRKTRIDFIRKNLKTWTVQEHDSLDETKMNLYQNNSLEKERSGSHKLHFAIKVSVNSPITSELLKMRDYV